MKSYQLNSLGDTDAVGKIIGQHIPQGTILLLTGNLGAGKTTMTKSICAAMGVDPDTVISPTYTMVNIYEEGQWPIHHVDLYRLTNPDDLDGFDHDDLISEEGVTLVEWPQFLVELLDTEPQLAIRLQSQENNECRLMEVEAFHHAFDSLFETLKPYEHTCD